MGGRAGGRLGGPHRPCSTLLRPLPQPCHPRHIFRQDKMADIQSVRFDCSHDVNFSRGGKTGEALKGERSRGGSRGEGRYRGVSRVVAPILAVFRSSEWAESLFTQLDIRLIKGRRKGRRGGIGRVRPVFMLHTTP